jgi:hypothetical protein
LSVDELKLFAEVLDDLVGRANVPSTFTGALYAAKNSGW